MGSPYRTNVDLAKELLAEGHPLVCEFDGHLIDLQPRWHHRVCVCAGERENKAREEADKEGGERDESERIVCVCTERRRRPLHFY